MEALHLFASNFGVAALPLCPPASSVPTCFVPVALSFGAILPIGRLTRCLLGSRLPMGAAQRGSPPQSIAVQPGVRSTLARRKRESMSYGSHADHSPRLSQSLPVRGDPLRLLWGQAVHYYGRAPGVSRRQILPSPLWSMPPNLLRPCRVSAPSAPASRAARHAIRAQCP